jgi:hypothetical protein
VADVAGELADDGVGFRYRTVIVSVPRRAGKTTLTLAANLDRMDIIADARCWYTANRRETAARLFRDEWAPMIDPLTRLYRLRKSQGSEGIHKRRGSSRLQLFAPNADGLHSTNADTVTVDECWAFDIARGEDVEAGITPAQLTRPWRQTWLVSAGGTIESTWWDRWLTAGAQALPGVAMFDYGADAAASDYDPGNPAVWARSHPTAGIAFPMTVLEHEWSVRQEDAAFERAYLNVWPRPSDVVAAAGLDLEAWRAAAHPRATPARVGAVAFDVAGDRSSASIAVAGLESAAPGARVVVEVVDRRPGVAWLADAVRAVGRTHRGARLVADSLVAAAAVSELTRAGLTVTPIGAGDHARACGAFVDRLAAATLAHRSQAVLDDAVMGAARRPLGDAWLWSRARSGVDISPLVAVTLAAWVAATSAPRGRPAVVVAAEAPDSPRTARGPSRYPGAGFGRPGANPGRIR